MYYPIPHPPPPHTRSNTLTMEPFWLKKNLKDPQNLKLRRSRLDVADMVSKIIDANAASGRKHSCRRHFSGCATATVAKQ
jgi:hypothetical protein